MTCGDTDLIRTRSAQITYRSPYISDGMAVWRLVRSCKPLDENSVYCNLLQCDHFRDTCVAAERAADGAVIGWVSGYLLPVDPTVLFIWQVAIDQRFQGKGIAGRMLTALLGREACARVRTLRTTITADNVASWALFKSFARRHGADLQSAPCYRDDAHFDGAHATEHLVSIALPARTADAPANDRHEHTSTEGTS